MDKPDVDVIEGLSPAISIDQKSASPQPPLDRRHDHRGLRLPAPALRPHRRASTARTTARRSQRQTPQQIVDRILAAARGHPLPGAGARSCGAARASTRRCSRTSPAQGFVRARVDGEVVDIDEFLKRDRPPGPLRAAHDRGRRRPARAARGHRRAGSPTRWRRRCSWPRAWPRSSSSARGRDGRERDADVQPAPGLPASRPQLRGAGAAQLLVQLAVRRLPARATGSAPRSRSTPSWSSPTPTCRSTTARSRRGAAPTRSTSPGCSRRWPTTHGIDLDAPWANADGQAAEGHPPRHRAAT